MLNLENIDVAKQYSSDHEEIQAIKSYIYQLYNELNFRLQELDKLAKQNNESKGE